jgi:hypothetical protein
MEASEEVHSRKQQQQQLGEDTGVARFGAAVVLESDTAARGRRCSNSTCLVVEGIGVAAFKRCGSCRQRFYCSAHCQVSCMSWRAPSHACMQCWSSLVTVGPVSVMLTDGMLQLLLQQHSMLSILSKDEA